MPASSNAHPSSSTTLADEALLASVLARDGDALTRLYDRYSAAVFALCLRIVSDRAAAEEVTLDVFTELWEKADRFDASRGSPVGYILGIARSRATDRLRRGQAKKRQPPAGLTTDRASLAAHPSASPDPPAAMELQEQRDRVNSAVAALDADERESLQLAYFDGLTHSEIAARLGQPLGTVKTRIRRAIHQLSELLRPRSESPDASDKPKHPMT